MANENNEDVVSNEPTTDTEVATTEIPVAEEGKEVTSTPEVTKAVEESEKPKENVDLNNLHSAIADIRSENEFLRQQLESSVEELAIVRKAINDNDLISEEDKKQLSTKQNERLEAQKVERDRLEQLEREGELLAVHPAFPGFKELVTPANIQAIIEVAASDAISEGEFAGKSKAYAENEMRKVFLNLRNPMTTAYNILSKIKPKTPAVVTPPKSIADAGSGGGKKGSRASILDSKTSFELRDMLISKQLTKADYEAYQKGELD